MIEPDPGYCAACGGFHLLTPVPEWGGSACAQCTATRRHDPPEPGRHHVCNTGDRHKPGRPEYRRCTCGQWFWAGNGYWYRVSRPPSRWLREHGVDPGEFWGVDEELRGVTWFEEVARGRPPLLLFLRWLFSGRS